MRGVIEIPRSCDPRFPFYPFLYVFLTIPVDHPSGSPNALFFRRPRSVLCGLQTPPPVPFQGVMSGFFLLLSWTRLLVGPSLFSSDALQVLFLSFYFGEFGRFHFLPLHSNRPSGEVSSTYGNVLCFFAHFGAHWFFFGYFAGHLWVPCAVPFFLSSLFNPFPLVTMMSDDLVLLAFVSPGLGPHAYPRFFSLCLS